MVEAGSIYRATEILRQILPGVSPGSPSGFGGVAHKPGAGVHRRASCRRRGSLRSPRREVAVTDRLGPEDALSPGRRRSAVNFSFRWDGGPGRNWRKRRATPAPSLRPDQWSTETGCRGIEASRFRWAGGRDGTGLGFCGRIRRSARLLGEAPGALRRLTARQMAAGDEQVGQRAGHQQAMGVLVDAAMAQLGTAEDPLDDADRMLDPGPHFRLGSVFDRSIRSTAPRWR